MSDRTWGINLNAALILVRNLRAMALALDIDPRALRVALKVALMIDTECMKKHGMTPQQDTQLSTIAEDLYRKTPRGEW